MATSLRTDYDAVSVWQAAWADGDAAQTRRLLAIAAVYDGMSRADAAKVGGMDRQTLREWVHRFDAAGRSGLVDHKAPGAERKLTPDQLIQFAKIMETGPGPETDGVVRWRRLDL